jgi:chorismate--pyruvate lyase
VSHIYKFSAEQLTLPFRGGCTNHWLNESELFKLGPLPELTPALSSWLFDRGSLTTRLTGHCDEFSVVVLNSGDATISAQEQQLFSDVTMPLNCREVLLLCDGIPQVYARSLIPSQALEQSNLGLRQLGNNSLGQILFQTPHAQRGVIEVARFDRQSSVAKLAEQLNLTVSHDLWGRRSLFTLQQCSLLVSEIFLPGALAYQEVST